VAVSTGPAVQGLSRFSLTTGGAGELAAFYENALGCRRIATEQISGAAFEALMGVGGGALRITLNLGEQIIELLQFDQRGNPYPENASASDLIFQHFAIVVSDMAQAYARLCATPHWTPISNGGPQKLPQSSGGATAFKFRDPEGHPLELLAFPPNNMPVSWHTSRAHLCLGIDHSAISVSNIDMSAKFYDSLGFEATSRSMNRGLAQQNLDGLPDVTVEVVALAIKRATPHLELLCYRSSAPPRQYSLRNNDIAATRIVLADSNAALRCFLDPDGHHFVMVPR